MGAALLRRAGGNPATAAAAFSPLALSIAGWYRGSLGLYQERTGASATTPALLLADPVGTWQDQSPHQRHLTAGADDARGALQLDLQAGQPGVRLDGTNDRYLSAALATLLAGADTPRTFFHVSRSHLPAQTYQVEVLLAGPGFPFDGVYNAATATGMTWSRRDDGAASVAPTFTDDRSTFRILELVFSGTALTVRRNGTTVLAAAAADVGALTLDTFALGGGPPFGFFAGDILEFQVYPTALADGDAARVRSDLASRYGIAGV